MDSRGARTKASSSPNFMKTSRSCDASATTWNLCVHAKAMASRSTVSSVCCLSSRRNARAQEVLDDSLEAVAFTPDSFERRSIRLRVSIFA